METPLICKIEDGCLVVKIGISTLAIAAANCEEFWDARLSAAIHKVFEEFSKLTTDEFHDFIEEYEKADPDRCEAIRRAMVCE